MEIINQIKYFTAKDLSLIFNVKPGTIYKWVDRKKIRSVEFVGRILFTEESLAEFKKLREK